MRMTFRFEVRNLEVTDVVAAVNTLIEEHFDLEKCAPLHATVTIDGKRHSVIATPEYTQIHEEGFSLDADEE